MLPENINRPKWTGFGILVLMLAAFGWFIIPAHVTSLWMDWEFTDWISPIANRLHDGARLYTDGLHMPMPPLPYLLVRLLHPDGATWLQENFLHYCFQAATLLLLYHLLARRAGAGLAFAATMAATVVFWSFGKSMLYDSMAQFFVAVCGGGCASLIQSQSPNAPSGGSRATFRPAVLLGIALGLLMLSKQSTGMGTLMGVCLALLFFPADLAFRRRCINVLAVGLATAVCVCVVSLAFSHFLSFRGMIQDVFLTGTEPKGGPRRMFNNLARYAFYVSEVMVFSGLVFWIFSLVRGKTGWRDQWNALKSALNLSVNAYGLGVGSQARVILVVSLMSAIGALAVYFVSAHGRGALIQAEILKLSIPLGLLNLGLAACLALAAIALVQGLSEARATLGVHPLTPFVIVYFSAAVSHSLSVTGFRWAWENNPLIVVALVFLFSPLVTPAHGVRQKRALAARLGLLCAAIAIFWCGFFLQFKAVLACTESWPEIKQLAGAKLRPDSESTRELVKIVRAQANPNTGDTVLLLPNDPNVEAWFERPRPALSSAIIFTDQYWDRYVDQDFATLQAHPPKVIVIGPRNYWLPFSRIWHWRKEEGAIRLIDRVKNELLPRDYELSVAHPILHGGQMDFMDVYVRKATPEMTMPPSHN